MICNLLKYRFLDLKYFLFTILKTLLYFILLSSFAVENSMLPLLLISFIYIKYMLYKISLCLSCYIIYNIPWCVGLFIYSMNPFKLENHDFQLWKWYTIYLFDDFPPLFSQVSLSRDIIITHILNFLDWCSYLLNSSISVFWPTVWEISWSLFQLTYWDSNLCNHIFRVPYLLLPFGSNTFLFHLYIF